MTQTTKTSVSEETLLCVHNIVYAQNVILSGVEG